MPAKTAEARAAYESARARSEQVLLRFTPDEAQRLRDAAVGSGKSLAAYVLCALEGQPRPIVDLADLSHLSEAFTALRAAPQAVRDLEADLGRLSGRLSHFFTMDYALASEHREEIHATLHALDALLLAVPPAIADLQAETQPSRAALARILDNVAAALET